MGVTANALETYDSTMIRENLQEALISISPTDNIFMSSVGSKSVDNTLFEWGAVSLQTAANNRAMEGEVAPSVNTATMPVRLSNYTQISTKVVETTSTAQASNGVGSHTTQAKQIAYKLKELRRDQEKMMLDNVAAVAGSSGNARTSAGMAAFIRSNGQRGTGGAAPTLSGTTAGYPNAAATDASTSNQRAITEAHLKSVIKDAWEAGAEPSMVLCGAFNKTAISAFTGNATKYQEVDGKKLTAAIDIYVSDFNTVSIVPARQIRARDVIVIDPSYARICYLQNAKQEPLAKTGLADRTMISVEYGLQVDTEEAHGIIADCTTA